MTEVSLTRDRVGLGVASMLAGVAAMVAMDTMAKWLGTGYPVGQIVFFRNAFALIPVLLFVAFGGGLPALRTRQLPGQALRAALGLGATLCFFTGLRYMPLAEAIALAFAGPLFVTALSVPILGERVGLRRWAAVIVGFLGVLVMTRPGAAAFRPEALLILAAALCYALAMLVSRRLSRHEGSLAILFHGTVIATALAAPLLPFGWRTPDLPDLGVFLLLGTVGGIGGFCLIQAFRYAPAAVIAPFEYTALLWGAVLGWLIWRELPEATVWLGAAIVAASSLYIIHRETRP